MATTTSTKRSNTGSTARARGDPRQPDVLGSGRRHPRLHLPVLCHRLLRDDEEPLQHHPQRHFRRDHCAWHDAGHHHRRHRPVGWLGALPCSMVLAVVMHAGYSIEVGIAASIGTALLDRGFQRDPDCLSRLSTFRGHARHAVDRAQPGDGRIQQHGRLPVRTGSR